MPLSDEERIKLEGLLGQGTQQPKSDSGFDISTAVAVEDSGFDISTAQPVEQPTNRLAQAAKTIGDFPGMPLFTPYRDIPGVLATAANAAGGGIPSWLYRNITNQPYPEPSTLRGKILGTAVGATAGLPMLAARGAGLQIASRFPQAPAFLTRAAEGAAGGIGFDIPEAVNEPIQGLKNAAIAAAANIVIPPAIKKVTGMFSKKPRTLGDIRILNEKEISKLPAEERQAHFASRNLEDSQLIAKERLLLRQRYQDVINKVKEDQRSLGKAAPVVAYERLKGLRVPFDRLRTAHNRSYANGINEALAAAPEGDVFFTKDEIVEAVANKYLRPQFPGSPPILQDDPTEYRQLLNLLDDHPIVNRNEISARDILSIADSEYNKLSPLAKGGLKSPTPNQTQSVHLRDILLDLMEKKGIDVRPVKADWADWVPVRNIGFKLLSPSGPSQLIRIARGLDPVRGEHLEQLEALIGQSLRSEVKAIYTQLDDLGKQKVIEGAKQLEAQRLLQQKIGFMKESRIEQKLRIDQLAAHSERINKLIFEIARGAAATAGAGAIVGIGYAIKKALD